MHHRWVARGAVVALHAAALLALWHYRTPLPTPPGQQRITQVRLIAPARPVAAWAPRPEPRPTATTAARQAPTVPRSAEPSEPATPATAAAPAVLAPEAPIPPEPPRTTLRLTLPPGYAASSAAARNPALTDPRSNTPRLTLEDRIADATGGAGAWVEERTSENRSQSVGALGDHRTVMRRGDTCVEIFRSRIADTDPFNANVAPRAISMVGRPYKCR